jgi:hypothetical protein
MIFSTYIEALCIVKGDLPDSICNSGNKGQEVGKRSQSAHMGWQAHKVLCVSFGWRGCNFLP